jgi:hypothetical protein
MKILILSVILASTSAYSQKVEKGPRQLARKLYVSLTGTTPTGAELDKLVEKISAQQLDAAALDIIDQRNGISNNGAFYNVTVKDMVTPWTNKAHSTLEPLNDMSATIIGWIRDEKQFNKILYSDTVYKASGVTFKGELTYITKADAAKNSYCSRDIKAPADMASDLYRIVHNNPKNPNDPNDKGCRLTKFSKAQLDAAYEINALYLPHVDIIINSNLINATNDHYVSISALGLDLSDKDLLAETSQEVKIHQYPQAISGLLSTRTYAAAYIYAGTNRAAVAYAMEHFLCKDMEQLNDTSIPDFRNRRDVDRSPGGTSEIYKNRCIGCHAGMDALAGAFAYYDYVNYKVVYTPGKVVNKMNHNVVFPEGFVTQNDSWLNLWTEGQNASLKWGGTTSGEGAKSFGMMLSQTEAFHSCMATRVYEKVCSRKATGDVDHARVAKLTNDYKNSKFNMKTLFVKASIECAED